MNIADRLQRFEPIINNGQCTLVAVTKTHSVPVLQEAYEAGLKDFGENRVQELLEKFEKLPKDINWHMIGHLQRNKVKQIAAFVHLIHSVDSLRLLKEVNKQGKAIGRVINCLLQMHIAREESKFGLSEEELVEILELNGEQEFSHVRIRGLMGMATNTRDGEQVRGEFRELKMLFDRLKAEYTAPNLEWKELSMGMSSDYTIALEEGSTMIRVGSALFGNR